MMIQTQILGHLRKQPWPLVRLRSQLLTAINLGLAVCDSAGMATSSLASQSHSDYVCVMQRWEEVPHLKEPS